MNIDKEKLLLTDSQIQNICDDFYVLSREKQREVIDNLLEAQLSKILNQIDAIVYDWFDLENCKFPKTLKFSDYIRQKALVPEPPKES